MSFNDLYNIYIALFHYSGIENRIVLTSIWLFIFIVIHETAADNPDGFNPPELPTGGEMVARRSCPGMAEEEESMGMGGLAHAATRN